MIGIKSGWFGSHQ